MISYIRPVTAGFDQYVIIYDWISTNLYESHIRNGYSAAKANLLFPNTQWLHEFKSKFDL